MKSHATDLADLVLIFLGVALCGTAVIQLIQPDEYRAVARVEMPSANAFTPVLTAEINEIRSLAVLTNATAALNLNDVWGKEYNHGHRLSDAAVQRMLRTKLDLELMSNTRIVSIKVLDENPVEAANLANSIAENYVRCKAGSGVQPAQMLESATAPALPSRPNRNRALVSLVFGALFLTGGVLCLKNSAALPKSRTRREEGWEPTWPPAPR